MIYLIRHGQTDWNVFPERFQGQTDIPLNSAGILQAQGLADYFREKPIDRIYSSPLIRALQTAKCIAEAKSMEPVIEGTLCEQNLGIWEGKYYHEIAMKFNIDFIRWLLNPYQITAPQGESFKELEDRVVDCYQSILRKEKGRNIVIVSHLWVIRILIHHFNQSRPLLAKPGAKHAYSLPIKNGGIIEIS